MTASSRRRSPCVVRSPAPSAPPSSPARSSSARAQSLAPRLRTTTAALRRSSSSSDLAARSGYTLVDPACSASPESGSDLTFTCYAMTTAGGPFIVRTTLSPGDVVEFEILAEPGQSLDPTAPQPEPAADEAPGFDPLAYFDTLFSGDAAEIATLQTQTAAGSPAEAYALFQLAFAQTITSFGGQIETSHVYLTDDGVLLCVDAGLLCVRHRPRGRRRPARRLHRRRQRDRPPSRPAGPGGDRWPGHGTCPGRLPGGHRAATRSACMSSSRPRPTRPSSSPTPSTSTATATSPRSTGTRASVPSTARHGARVPRPRLPRRRPRRRAALPRVPPRRHTPLAVVLPVEPVTEPPTRLTIACPGRPVRSSTRPPPTRKASVTPETVRRKRAVAICAITTWAVWADYLERYVSSATVTVAPGSRRREPNN